MTNAGDTPCEDWTIAARGNDLSSGMLADFLASHAHTQDSNASNTTSP